MRKNGDSDGIPMDFNILLETTHAFKVDIKEFIITHERHIYAITKMTDVINELLKKESDAAHAYSDNASFTFNFIVRLISVRTKKAKQLGTILEQMKKQVRKEKYEDCH